MSFVIEEGVQIISALFSYRISPESKSIKIACFASMKFSLESLFAAFFEILTECLIERDFLFASVSSKLKIKIAAKHIKIFFIKLSIIFCVMITICFVKANLFFIV